MDSDEHARSTCGVLDLRQQLVRRCVWQWTVAGGRRRWFVGGDRTAARIRRRAGDEVAAARPTRLQGVSETERSPAVTIPERHGCRRVAASDRHAVEGHGSRGRRDGNDRRQRRSVGRVAVASKIGRKRVVPGRDQRADFETKQSQANYNAVKAL